MAEQLKGPYSFTRGRPGSLYPWDEWLNEAVWRLTTPTDFSVPIDTFRSMAYSAAARKGLSIRTQVEDENTLILQAYKKETE